MVKILDESKINYKTLNVSFMKKDFIENYDSNYEEYLNEFINNSKFVTDNGNQLFELNKQQSDGEADSTNKEYDLEYKLFIDTETLVNKSNFSHTITIDSNGARFYGASKKEGKHLIVNLKDLVSQHSLKELNEIKCKNQPNKEEAKIKRFISKLEIDKNIVFLIPYEYYYDSNIVDKVTLDFIIEKFSKDFNVSFLYRKQYTSKDMYIAFFIKGYIIFTKVVDSKLIFYDKVSISKSKSFNEIYDIANPFNDIEVHEE